MILVDNIKNLPKYTAFLKRDPKEDAKYDYFNAFLKSKGDVEKYIDKPLEPASVLILGCGYYYPDVILYSRYCKRVVGVDVLSSFYRDGFSKLYQQYNKLNPKVKSVISSFQQRYGLRKYFTSLHGLSQANINHESYELVAYDGQELPFPNRSFDVIISNAVLEHVLDLDAFFSEARRVLRDSGTTYHLYHNFCSFSGGHLLESLCLENPWGHLRDIYETAGLNILRFQDILTKFSKFFEIESTYPTDKNHNKMGIDNDFLYEQEDLLSDELAAELSAYSREELLSRGYLVIGRKRGN